MTDTPPNNRAGRWPFAAVAGMLALAWLAFTSPWLTGAVTVPWDAKAHFYPQLQFLAAAREAGQSSMWTPHVFSGSAQISDPQSLFFSLPHRLAAYLSANPSFALADAVPFAALLMGALAVAALFRDRGWHPAGAVVAGIAFMFGGSAAWRIQHVGQVMSLAWFPVTLWLLDRALARRSFLGGLAAGVAGGLLLIGRDQVAGLSALILIAYGVTVLAGDGWREGIKRRWRPLAGAVIAAGLVAGVPLLLTAVAAGYSNRVFIDYDGAGRGSLHPANLITAFVANLFGTDGEFKEFWGPPSPLWGPVDLYVARNMSNLYSGALVGLAVVFGAAGGGLWHRGARFFGIALLAMVLYALGRYTPAFRIFYEMVPGVDLFRRPADGTFLVGALAAIAAGHVVHRLASGQTHLVTRAGRVAVSVSLAAVLSGLALALAKNRLGYAWPMLLEGTLWLAAAMVVAVVAVRLAPARPLAAAALLGVFLTADLVRNNGPNESTALPPAMFDVLRPDSADPTIALLKQAVARTRGPDRLDRVELAAIDFHWPNASMVHGLHNTLGYNPLRLKLYADAVGAGDHVALADQRNWPPSFPSYASPLANLLGLRYIATRAPLKELDKALPEGALREVARTATATIYENPAALPRVMMVPRAEVADFEAIRRTGQWPRSDFQDVVLFNSLPDGAPKGSKRGTATIREYSNRQVIVEVQSEEGGFLVLNDPVHPWWFAYVDTYTTQMLTANLMFRAVQLPPGKHEVIFRFNPWRGVLSSLIDRLNGRAWP